MRVLFDQATPIPIRLHLERHNVRTVAQEGWSTLKNGELLAAAEAAGFDALLTTDKTSDTSRTCQNGKLRLSFWGNSNGRGFGPTFRSWQML